MCKRRQNDEVRSKFKGASSKSLMRFPVVRDCSQIVRKCLQRIHWRFSCAQLSSAVVATLVSSNLLVEDGYSKSPSETSQHRRHHGRRSRKMIRENGLKTPFLRGFRALVASWGKFGIAPVLMQLVQIVLGSDDVRSGSIKDNPRWIASQRRTTIP